MTGLFITIVNMSITASYVALAVIIARCLLKRVPKIFSYILWSAVAIRLLIPVSYTSAFSLMKLVQPASRQETRILEYVPHDIGLQKNPVLDVGMSSIRQLFPLPKAALGASMNPMQLYIGLGMMIWLTGVVALLAYTVYSYLRVRRTVRTATLVRDRIFETDRITTPFVFGIIRPRIYIPTGIPEQGLRYMVEHELVHIRRGDHIVKPIAYLLLIVHWFNPLMWLSYRLMTKDMEMSCDERVVRAMGDGSKTGYATALLSIAIDRSHLRLPGPLAFGESDVKARIKNILAFRQPSSKLVVVILFFVGMLVTGFLANPKPIQPSALPLQSTVTDNDQIYDLDKLMANQTLYVGNASKVGGLISGLPHPQGMEGKGMELQTKEEPYGVTIIYELTNTEQSKGTDLYYRNAILLLSLINNVDYITYRINHKISDRESSAMEITISRAEANQIIGEDVRHFAESKQSVRKLIDRVEYLYNGQH
ncbi:M56 family metallopeptidase [Paenibacillus glycanilyticus]|uniref:Peptidase M56 BlaR1 n=1 Tax=Paenibacillus glycanilyticus TaxID=126569 RepID=A0ABQ6GPE4_9BACL|nr:M56 family metallopeptidase [Paenibacillus glycanilyticus]GLX71231.1 hypothetical protein MU1_55800 [Paenibacillus glycanilyticus]